jgi:excisionase family DNA binding protein
MNTLVKTLGAEPPPRTKPLTSGWRRDEPNPASWQASLPAGPLLTISEVRGYLRCSRDVVMELIADGRLAAVRLHRAYRIPLESVQQLVRKGVAI